MPRSDGAYYNLDMNEEESPKLQVDLDWKAEAQAEKARLEAKAETQATESTNPQGELPEASFQT